MESGQQTLISAKNPQYIRRPIKLPDLFYKKFSSSSTSPESLKNNLILNRSLEQKKATPSTTIQNNHINHQNKSLNNSRNIIIKSKSPSPSCQSQQQAKQCQSKKRNKNNNNIKSNIVNDILNNTFDEEKYDGEEMYIYINQANQVLQQEELRREIYPIKTIPYLPKTIVIKNTSHDRGRKLQQCNQIHDNNNNISSGINQNNNNNNIYIGNDNNDLDNKLNQTDNIKNDKSLNLNNSNNSKRCSRQQLQQEDSLQDNIFLTDAQIKDNHNSLIKKKTSFENIIGQSQSQTQEQSNDEYKNKRNKIYSTFLNKNSLGSSHSIGNLDNSKDKNNNNSQSSMMNIENTKNRMNTSSEEVEEISSAQKIYLPKKSQNQRGSKKFIQLFKQTSINEQQHYEYTNSQNNISSPKSMLSSIKNNGVMFKINNDQQIQKQQSGGLSSFLRQQQYQKKNTLGMSFTSVSSEISSQQYKKSPEQKSVYKTGLQTLFQGVLKVIKPLLYLKKRTQIQIDTIATINGEIRKSINISKFCMNQKIIENQKNLAKKSEKLIESDNESIASEEEELEVFENIKQDKGIIDATQTTFDIQKKQKKTITKMYSFLSPLEIKINQMNHHKVLLFNKLETFDESIANQLVQDGLSVKIIENQNTFVENDLMPEQWIEKIQEIKGPFHARCLFYKDKKYQWEKVQVLEYSEEKLKFKVQQIEGNIIKYVSRNVLAFRYERMENIIQRIQMIQHKNVLIKEEQRFQNYLNTIDNKNVLGIPRDQKQRIFNLCLRENYVSKVHNKVLSEKILYETIEEVDNLYKNKMKESLVINQMQKQENYDYFKNKVLLEPRIMYIPIFPKKGYIYDCAENFTQIIQQIILNRNIYLKEDCQKALCQVQKINLNFAKQSMFDTELQQVQLPISVHLLLKYQNIDNMRISLKANYRENVIHEIFDKLQKQFKFFEINKEVYFKSKLNRFLKRIEFQIVNSLQTNMFEYNCDEWLRFLQSFAYPQIKLLSQEYQTSLKIQSSSNNQFNSNQDNIHENNDDDNNNGNVDDNSENNVDDEINKEISKINLKEVWISQNKSLLHLQVKCNDQGKIIFEPNLDQIRENLNEPLYLLNELANSFQRLEKTAVPLIDLDYTDNYMLETSSTSYISRIREQINELIQIQWESYVVPVIEKYSLFSHFFISEQTYLKQLFDFNNNNNHHFNINTFYHDINVYYSNDIKNNYINNNNHHVNNKQTGNNNKSWIGTSHNNNNNNNNNGQQPTIAQLAQLSNSIPISNLNNEQKQQQLQQSQGYNKTSNNTNLTSKLDDKTDTPPLNNQLSGIQYQLSQLKDTESIRELLNKFHEDIQKVKILASDEIKTPLFLIDLQPCKKSTVYHEYSFDQLKLKISKYPNNEEDLVQIKIVIDGCENEIQGFYVQIIHIGKYIDLVEDFFYEIDQQIQEQYWMLYTYPQSVRERLKQSKQILESQEKKFKESVEKEKQILLLKIEKISQDFQSIKNFNNYQLAKDYSIEAESLNEHINDAIYSCQQINKREALLAMPYQIKSQSIYFIQLWELAFQLQIDRHKWMLGSLMKISFEQFKNKIQEYDKNKEEIKSKIYELVEDKSILKVISEIQKDIDQSREISWMIEYLTTEAMIKKPQFFRDLFRECNLPVIEPNEDMSLKALIDIDLVHFRDQIREASERADNVFNTEKQLLQIQDKLKETLLDLGEFRESFIIINIEILQNILIEQNHSLNEIKDSDRTKLAPKKVQEIDLKLQSLTYNINSIAQFQELYTRAADLIDKIEYEKKTNSIMKPFHQSESFWRGVIRQIKENNCLFETDFQFDYTNQIMILQKFFQQLEQ